MDNSCCLVMSTKTSRSIKLLDLNQDVLHEIFGYIERKEGTRIPILALMDIMTMKS